MRRVQGRAQVEVGAGGALHHPQRRPGDYIRQYNTVS
jgi:hypothetical protein